MKERPILFSGAMVRALFAGTKTQTRRIVRPEWFRCLDPEDADDMPRILAQCPYGVPGDRLWVRETWCDADTMYQGHQNDVPSCIGYPADKSAILYDAKRPTPVPSWDLAQWNWDALKMRPSIFMPRWASRIDLELVSVRCERLQDITEDEIRAEGVTEYTAAELLHGNKCPVGAAAVGGPRDWWRVGWDAINGERAPWASNPWVWALTFRRARP